MKDPGYLPYPNKVARVARLRALLLLPLLPVLACCFAATQTAKAQQSTLEACRETKKVRDQYDREFLDARRQQIVKESGNYYRGRLSDFSSAIAGGFVVSGLRDTAEALKVIEPENVGSSTKEMLAFQKTVSDVLERALQEARGSSADELNSRVTRLVGQLRMRDQRMKELHCEEVLAREESSSNNPERNQSTNGCVGFAGKWLTSIDNVVITLNSGGSGTYFWRGANNTISGSVSGNVLEGSYQQPTHPNDNLKSGRIKFVLSTDGNSFTGDWWYKDGTSGGSWNGTCQSGN